MPGKTRNRSLILRGSGFAVALVLLMLHLAALFAPEASGALARYRTGNVYFLAGGPGVALVMTLAAIRWERFAGVGLWLGAALASAGLALVAGPRFQWYAFGMLIWIVPQVLSGTLFLLSAHPAGPKKARMRPRIPGG